MITRGKQPVSVLSRHYEGKTSTRSHCVHRRPKLDIKEVPVILSFFRRFHIENPLSFVDDPEAFLQRVLTLCANRTCIEKPCANKVWGGHIRCKIHQTAWKKQQ